MELSDETIIRLEKMQKSYEELIIASKELLIAMEQVHFFMEGYKNGSASISEVNDAQHKEMEAYSKLWDIVNKKP